MQRVVSFYEKLPRGSAPEVKAKGLIGRYQAKHFGKNASATRMSSGDSLQVVDWGLLLINVLCCSYHSRHHWSCRDRLRSKLLLPLAYGSILFAEDGQQLMFYRPPQEQRSLDGDG
jgi:hypothetical protein